MCCFATRRHSIAMRSHRHFHQSSPAFFRNCKIILRDLSWQSALALGKRSSMIPPAHSSSVVLTLLTCEVEVAVSHLAANYLIVRDSQCSFEAIAAEIIVNVDGHERRHSVFLPHRIPLGELMSVSYF
jgi:hypothetical protein